ncbi:transcriptional regulator [Leifsonia sp. Root227]|uniref:helix-turn-helix transcriptional regulator n=1 Tax=Leifsonia sp. Root227 TaxID=1736496 RepID=UPI0006F1E3E1|nr:WYL domain-containing protein [Leifsonia sp. Root227]KRC51754.1 transcriptional regulator [Leifsonia sp. Root227]
MTATSSRLLVLLSLLQARRDWPGQLLAERLDISRRTVRRDVDRLREMGYSIRATKGPDGGYRLAAGSDLPPLLFDDDQAVAVAVALQAATVSGVGIEEAAVRALTTVRQVMPSRLRHRLDALQFTAMPNALNAAVEPVSTEVLVAVSAALRARETLRFDYRAVDAASAAATSDAARRVEPHHLVVSGERWYLVGWDLGRDDWRIFRVDRISPRIPNGRRFSPRELPGGDVRAFVSARFTGSETADEWPCRGSAVLQTSAAEVLPFAGDAVVDDLGDGRCRIHVGSWSWVALAASLGRFDAVLEDVQPRELLEAFGVLAGRYAAAQSGR